MNDLTHINEQGRAKMVDVSEKADTKRYGIASGKIQMQPETFARITSGQIKKGDVLAVAQVAGIMAAKKTWETIPMCHPIPITGADIEFELFPRTSEIEAIATVKTTGKTGIEMEALCAVSAALLTIYDMCKAIDRGMIIKDIMLLEKDGGKSGHYERGVSDGYTGGSGYSTGQSRSKVTQVEYDLPLQSAVEKRREKSQRDRDAGEYDILI